MIISIPRLNHKEIEYVCYVLFYQNLNIINISYEYKDIGNVELIGDKGRIEIQNIFFNQAYEELFTIGNLPSEKSEISINGEQISCLYGNSEFKYECDNYYIGGDIIGSAFFLLTQWESSLKRSDKLSRYQYVGSTLNRLDLYERPIVNEYIEALKTLLLKINISFRPNVYKPVFTCDIDSITKYKTFRNLLGGIRHRGLRGAILKEYLAAKKDKKYDVYYSFDYLFERLAKKGIDSIFYFMVEKNHPVIDTVDYDVNEEIIQSIVNKIKDKKYDIGLHPSIDSFDSKEKISRQKVKLERAINTQVKHIRQHFLQYDVRKTFGIMDAEHFVSDSSVQFEVGMGFAAGMCTKYALYDLGQRKRLGIDELPLVIMKKKDYVKDVSGSFQNIKKLVDKCKRYKGEYAVLFHNADLETMNEKMLFEQTLEIL